MTTDIQSGDAAAALKSLADLLKEGISTDQAVANFKGSRNDLLALTLKLYTGITTLERYEILRPNQF